MATVFKTAPWYLRILGFSYRYELKVLTDPVRQGDSWVYSVQYCKSALYWLNIKIK